MFKVNKYGQRVWVWGDVEHKVRATQDEFLRSGKWSLHTGKTVKRKSGKWRNFVLYFSDKSVCGKTSWRIGAGDKAFAGSKDYYQLLRASPATVEWLARVILGGEHYAPHPCPDGFPAPERRPRVYKKKAEREEEARQIRLERGRESVLLAIEMLDGSGASVPADQLIRMLRRDGGLTGDQARDILSTLREVGGVVWDENGWRLSALADQEIVDAIDAAGLSGRLALIGAEMVEMEGAK